MPEANVLVPNTGTAQIETTAIPQPDGSVSYRQRADIGDGTDIPIMRQLLEQLVVLWTSSLPFNADPSARAPRFDENDNIRVGLGVSLNGGAIPFKLIAAGTTNASTVKGAPGQVYGWFIFNNAAATRHVKLYNTKLVPNVGVDLPLLTLAFPAGAAANVWMASGIKGFTQGIGLATTVNAADNDSTAVTANDLIINVLYS